MAVALADVTPMGRAAIVTWKLASPFDVRRHRLGAQEETALAIAGRVGRWIAEDLDRVRRVRRVIERPDDRRRVAVSHEADQVGIGLEVVGGAGDAAGHVRGDAVVAQVDPQRGITEDRVGQDRVAGGGIELVVADRDAVVPVVRDDVPRAHGRAADGVVHGVAEVFIILRVTVALEHAVGPVAQGGAPRGGPDEVALDEAGRTAVEEDPIAEVARDHVPCAEGRADEPARAADRHPDALNVDPAAAVRQGERAGDVGADPVPLDDDAGAGLRADVDAVARVARDQVAGPRLGAADDVVRGVAEVDEHARAAAQRHRAGRVGADQVPLDDHTARGVDRHAVEGRPGDDVAGRRRQAADGIVVGPLEAHPGAVGRKRRVPRGGQADPVALDHVIP